MFVCCCSAPDLIRHSDYISVACQLLDQPELRDCHHSLIVVLKVLMNSTM